MHRRTLLLSGAAALAAAPDSLAAPAGGRFRFVHFTDTHIQKELKADEGVARCFARIRQARPDFCLAGGDLVFDVLETPKERARLLFDLYQDAVKKLECPVHSAPGNHDYFGVFEKSGVSPDDPDYGKKMFEERIGPRYKSFDHKGWHFVILDTVFLEGRKYKGFVDQEQMAWLQADLEKNGPSRPVIVLCHIPLVTAALQLVPGWREFGDAIVVGNAPEVVALLEKHPVRLVLQGHTHINEHVRWKGIDFITTGAVSGNWWKGPRLGFPEGFAVLETAGNSVSWRFESYPWQAVTEP